MKKLMTLALLFVTSVIYSQNIKVEKQNPVKPLEEEKIKTQEQTTDLVKYKYALLKEMAFSDDYLDGFSTKEKQYLKSNFDDIIDNIDTIIKHGKRKTRRLYKRECKPFRK